MAKVTTTKKKKENADFQANNFAFVGVPRIYQIAKANPRNAQRFQHLGPESFGVGCVQLLGGTNKTGQLNLVGISMVDRHF